MEVIFKLLRKVYIKEYYDVIMSSIMLVIMSSVIVYSDINLLTYNSLSMSVTLKKKS